MDPDGSLPLSAFDLVLPRNTLWIVLVEPSIGRLCGREHLHPFRVTHVTLRSMVVVVEINPRRSSGSTQFVPMSNRGVDLLSVGLILSGERSKRGVDFGREPGLFAGRFLGPFGPTVEGVRHGFPSLPDRGCRS
jgi:hypothetical protein